MFKRSELKRSAKNKLKGNWGIMVVIFLIYMGAESIIQSLVESKGLLFSFAVLILTAPIYLSIAKITLDLSTGEARPQISQLLYGFEYLFKTIGLHLIMFVAVGIGMIFFIVPGIIISLMFSQAVYILADNPEINIIDALKESIRLTKGYKWNMFILQISFIGLILLGLITLGIGLLWVSPYMKVTNAELYIYLKNQQLKEQLNYI